MYGLEIVRKAIVIVLIICIGNSDIATSQETAGSTTIASTTASPLPTSSSNSKFCGSGALGGGKCGWVPGPTTRSTSSILWSCFAVILLCTCKVIHDNVCTEVRAKAGWKQWLFYQKLLRKLGLMLVAVLGPEIFTTYAVQDRRSVKAICHKMDCSMVQAHFILMGGLAAEDSTRHRLIIHAQAVMRLDAAENAELVDQLPSDEDIMDRSKSDSFTTILACLQSLWLVVQCIARKAHDIDITELELSTCAFVVCSLITYIVWWSKPHNIEHRTIIHVKSLEAYKPETFSTLRRDISLSYESDYISMDENTVQTDEHANRTSYVMLILGVIFAVIHLLAWNWKFPSRAEFYLWRSASMGILGICVLACFLNLLQDLSGWDLAWMLGLTVIPYCILRIIIIVQIFLCFRSMPESVYQDFQWSHYIPHLT